MDKILTCDGCNSEYYVCYNQWRNARARKLKTCALHYCSFECRSSSNGCSTPKMITCEVCGDSKLKRVKDINKTNNNFCSSSCAATYNNTHKTKGTRRSKLEEWLEIQLTSLFPELEIKYSSKSEINSELDIYIPSMKLAFELNGIFHYEPIYGEGKLHKIQNNDQRKFQACLEHGIELCIIDTSTQKYFKESTSQKFLDIITKLVNLKLSKTDRVEVL